MTQAAPTGEGSADVAFAGLELLRAAIRRDFAGRIAVLSSFGTEAAVLLALVAEIDPATPVLFLQTGLHFAETLAYRDRLAALLGLTGVRNLPPDPATLRRHDPDDVLHLADPDACCALRKVAPLETALMPFAATISGRRRGHATTRRALQPVELKDGRSVFNPLADWDDDAVEQAFVRWNLPRHPLASRGYGSVGCAPCTQPGAGRSGRWARLAKTECGIHGRLAAGVRGA